MDDKELFEKLTELCDAIKKCDTGELTYIIIANYDDKVLGCIQGHETSIYWMIADMILRTSEHMEQSPRYIVACVLERLMILMKSEEEGENELE